jgi:hypothetical protein
VGCNLGLNTKTTHLHHRIPKALDSNEVHTTQYIMQVRTKYDVEHLSQQQITKSIQQPLTAMDHGPDTNNLITIP